MKYCKVINRHGNNCCIKFIFIIEGEGKREEKTRRRENYVICCFPPECQQKAALSPMGALESRTQFRFPKKVSRTQSLRFT